MRRLRCLLACLLAAAPALTAASQLASAQADDRGGKRDPLDPKVIARHKRTLAASPHDTAALANLLGLYRRHRTVELLRDVYQQALDRSPNDWATLVVLGHIQRTLRDDPRALDCWSRAVAQRPTDAATWVELGALHEGMGRDDEAVAEYRRAIKVAPKGFFLEAELTGRIVDLYRRKQSLPRLIAELEQEWPERARGHLQWSTLGKLHEETGAQDKAIAALRKAVAVAAWELDTQRRLIQMLENVGKDDEALAQYEAVVRVAPGEARFQLELAERYWRRGDAKRARDALARLQARFPQDPAVLSAIADLQRRWNQTRP